MNNLEVELFFRSLNSPGSNEIVVVIDTCSFIRYHEALATFLPTFHHSRRDLKFFIPWVVHQELDGMKARRLPLNDFDPQNIHSAINVIANLLDLTCEYSNLAFVFQTANDAANCAAANLPHAANDDDILLAALYLCHRNADGLRRVFVWTGDRILVNKIRVSGLSAISERDQKLVILSPASNSTLVTTNAEQVDFHAAMRHVVTPPDEEAAESRFDATKAVAYGVRRDLTPSEMAVDFSNDDASRYKTNSTVSGPSRQDVTGISQYGSYQKSPTATGAYIPKNGMNDSGWSNAGESIVPRYLQRPSLDSSKYNAFSDCPPAVYGKRSLSLPHSPIGMSENYDFTGTQIQSGRVSQMDLSPAMFWESTEPRSQSAVPTPASMNYGQRASQPFSKPFAVGKDARPATLQPRPGSYIKRNSLYASAGDDPLSLFLVDVVTREMIAAYGPDLVWTDICCLRRMPANWRDAIVCIDRHWIAVFKNVFGTAKVLTNARETLLRLARAPNPPAEEVTTAARVLANYIGVHPAHSNAARSYLRSAPFVAAEANLQSSPQTFI